MGENLDDQSYGRKSLLPLIIVVALIIGIGYYGLGSSNTVVADVGVYRPLTGSSGLSFVFTEINKEAIYPKTIAGIYNKIYFNEIITLPPTAYITVEMYRDNVKCDRISGKLGLGASIHGKLVCPITEGNSEITLKLLDQTGEVKEEKSFNI